MIGWFEDLRIGDGASLGSHRFTTDEIRRFAERFDPQPFHLDEAAAAASHFGGLIASGWHTAAVWMRLMVDHRRREQAAKPLAPGERLPRIGPSPGFRELAWLKPVRSGDTIAYSTVITGKRELASRPECGLVVSRNEGVNQDGELVIRFLGQVLVERRSLPDRP